MSPFLLFYRLIGVKYINMGNNSVIRKNTLIGIDVISDITSALVNK